MALHSLANQDTHTTKTKYCPADKLFSKGDVTPYIKFFTKRKACN